MPATPRRGGAHPDELHATRDAAPAMTGVRTVRITVALKPGVLDAQGQAIQKGLDALGYGGVRTVRAGRYFEIEIEDGPDLDARVRAMCEGLLANPLIEDYRYEVV